jgi:hypothetical protein
MYTCWATLEKVRLYVYVYVHIHIHAHIHTCAHKYMHKYIHMYTHRDTHTQDLILYDYAASQVLEITYSWYIYIYIYIYSVSLMQLLNTYTCIRTHAHTYMCTHTGPSRSSVSPMQLPRYWESWGVTAAMYGSTYAEEYETYCISTLCMRVWVDLLHASWACCTHHGRVAHAS